MLIDNIFVYLIKSSNFYRIVFPHLKRDYFTAKEDQFLFKKIKDYQDKYNKIPTYPNLKLTIDTDTDISVEDTQIIKDKLNSLRKTDLIDDEQLLIDETEEWDRNRAIEIATYDFIESLEKGKPDKATKIEKIKEAMAIQFVVEIGHDYFDDAEKRRDNYFNEHDKIPLDIELLNVAMGGGLVRKAMFLFMASTNVGKTIILCHCASALVRLGIDVLYVTGEESEEEILKKNDANLLDIGMDSLNKTLDKNLFNSRFKELCSKAHGRLKVKEFPTGAASALHVKNLLMELKLKQNFVPVVVILDGINNFASSKLPPSQAGSPIYVKNVAEEQRALAMEMNYALLSNAQFNRGAKAKKEAADLEDVGEAYAISQTGDWAGALIQTDELREQGKYLVKNMKTRFGKNKGKIYTIGIDYDKMRMHNLSADQQEIPLHIKDQMKAQQQKRDASEEAIALFDFGD